LKITFFLIKLDLARPVLIRSISQFERLFLTHQWIIWRQPPWPGCPDPGEIPGSFWKWPFPGPLSYRSGRWKYRFFCKI